MSANLPAQVPTPDTSPDASDLLYKVDDPYGTPADDATTIGNAVTKGHGLSDGATTSITSGVLTSDDAPTARTNLGLATSDSPQFAGLNIGNASDTTVTRAGAGDIAVEGNGVYRAGGTDVPLTDGGTGASTAAGALANLSGQAGADFSLNSHKLTSVTDPTSAQDAATKAYVDAVAQGLSPKSSVLLATAAALPANTYLANVITITATGTLTVDGTVTALNDRILVKDESAQLENGIYVVTTAGAIGVAAVLTRSSDMDVAAEFPGAFVFSESGTVNAAAGFVCTNSAPPTVGTDAITFTQFSGAGEITAGTGLSKSANTLSIDTSVTVDKTTAQTLTNKTLTSPAITTPTGIVKGDVGLGNVDNTSDATKNAASVALTNKDLTSGTNTFPTLNQNTTGSAAKLTTARNIAGVSFDGTANISIASTNLSDTASIALTTNTITLSNKRLTPRVTTIVSSATPTINTDNCDAVTITALATAITSMTTNLSGTPTNFDKLTIRLKDDGTARAITWGASFEAKGVALPTTTVISKVLTVGFIYDTVTTRWGCVAAVSEA